jgi:hypothetical protein
VKCDIQNIFAFFLCESVEPITISKTFSIFRWFQFMYGWYSVRAQFRFLTCSFVNSRGGYICFLRQPSDGFRGAAKHFVLQQFVVRKQSWSVATWCICDGSRFTKLAQPVSNCVPMRNCTVQKLHCESGLHFFCVLSRCSTSKTLSSIDNIIYWP